MAFDVLLLSAILTCGWLGQMLLRRLGPGQRTYGYMLLGDLALAVVALVLRADGDDARLGDLIGTVALGGAVCLVMVPPLLRDLGRRAAATDRLGLARALTGLRELFQPGMGARFEGELIDTVRAVRAGRTDDAVAALVAQRQGATPAARRFLDERIALTYLHGRRFADAVEVYERDLARRGSPQLEVELVRAYCELGRLDGAAELIARLEASPIGQEPTLWPLFDRARLVYLAFAGRVAAVDALVAQPGALGVVPDAARDYWSGLVRLNAGDVDGARVALESARRRAGKNVRARELAEAALERLAAAGPAQLSAEAAALADRLSVARVMPARPAAPPRLGRVPLARMRVTAALVVANLVAYGLVSALVGDPTDVGVLMSVGANLKPATQSGEAWRLLSSMFLHGGAVHLLINLYNLWVLGRLVEQIVGPVRLLGLYVAAGVAGSAASAWLGGAAPSVGASGAVLGLLGAALAEVLVHRAAYPARWSRALVPALVFVTLAQVGIGFLVPNIDQAAHIGGLVTGFVLGAALSRKARLAEHPVVRGAVATLAVVSLLALGYGAIGAAATELATSLRGLPTVERSAGGLRVTVASEFVQVAGGQLAAEGLGMNLILTRGPGTDLEGSLDGAADELVAGRARELGFTRASRVRQPTLGLPTPWRGREIELEIAASGQVQRYRAVVFARAAEAELWGGILFYPAGLGAAVAPMLADVLASARAD